jgi:FkbM family methyltransferase
MSFRTLSYILDHPLTQGHKVSAVARYVRWQIGSRFRSGKTIVPFVGNMRLAIRRGMTSATGNLYCGLQEFEDMAFVLHALRPGDLFLDVGANVGVYSVLAAGVAGAQVLGFEPSPATFHDYTENLQLNHLAPLVTPHNVALGGKEGELRFTTSFGTVNHIASAADTHADTVVVPVKLLDQVVAGKDPFIMKIDVEGYETEVIAGAAGVLANPALCGMLMEFNGSGARYGYDEPALRRKILSLGFEPCRYDPFARTLTPLNAESGDNILFARHLPRLRERLKSAPKISVNGVSF